MFGLCETNLRTTSKWPRIQDSLLVKVHSPCALKLIAGSQHCKLRKNNPLREIGLSSRTPRASPAGSMQESFSLPSQGGDLNPQPGRTPTSRVANLQLLIGLCNTQSRGLNLTVLGCLFDLSYTTLILSRVVVQQLLKSTHSRFRDTFYASEIHNFPYLENPHGSYLPSPRV